MRFTQLNDWLTWQETLNPKEIELGLDRVSQVLAQAGLSNTFNCPLITVAGTNGKGSVVAMLEALAMAAGLKVCSYTSPHIFKYNERIRINGEAVDDKSLREAFERLDQARAELPLTYFEFGTLAAIDLFFKQQPDLVILEVGLGGRLDAVNIMDSDVSVLTSVAVDHVDWLGDNTESIGYEKAGIFRAGKPVVCGELNTPQTVFDYAEQLQCNFMQIERDYDIKIDGINGHWDLQSKNKTLSNLAQPGLLGKFQYRNAATAIVALQSLPIALSKETISVALAQMKLPGRFQVIANKPIVYVDVAHNPQAAKALASQLRSSKSDNLNARTWAVFAMLSDKDAQGVVDEVFAEIDCWCLAGLDETQRGLSAQALLDKLAENFKTGDSNAETNEKNQCKMQGNSVLLMDTVAQACEAVITKLDKNDRVIIFGSFHTVAEAMNYFSKLEQSGTKTDSKSERDMNTVEFIK